MAIASQGLSSVSGAWAGYSSYWTPSTCPCTVNNLHNCTVALDILPGATVAPISQGRKMRPQESRTLAPNHREVTAIANTQNHILFVTQSSCRRWYVNAVARLCAPSRQCCLPHSSPSWNQAQDLTHLYTSYLESLPKPATKPDTSRLFFAGSIMGGSMVEKSTKSPFC